ncbi:MAG: VIT1/CCC1 transporter family protein [Pseudomonadota bacterium]
MRPRHVEGHNVHRIGWLRAAVLGANDGLVSTASMIVGVSAAAAGADGVLTAGIAGLVAGAMAMAAGEYVSVSSQADAENADLERERQELATQPAFELDELTRSFVDRGVEPATARDVAAQLTAHDALAAHAQEELGISDATAARPLQAAMASAAAFTAGAALPLLTILAMPRAAYIPAVTLSTLAFLGGLGALGAKAGGAKVGRATLRVMFWGAMAMALTALVGALFGAVV